MARRIQMMSFVKSFLLMQLFHREELPFVAQPVRKGDNRSDLLHW